MPDSRTQRGPHPKDHELFSDRWVPILRSAVDDLSWLMTRGYSSKAALQIVGDRHSLRDRQRKALQRCAAARQACEKRAKNMLSREDLKEATIVVDGYNVLLTLEAGLSGGLLLLARDGALRDLAAMSAHYRSVQSTMGAIEMLAQFFAETGCTQVICYLDKPVSNSARLKRLIQETVAERTPPWRVNLTDRTDRLLANSPHVVATADSAIIDNCDRWFNLARAVVDSSIPDAWILDLRQPSGGTKPV